MTRRHKTGWSLVAADLAAILGYDLDAEIEAKRAVLIDRWGDPS